MLCSTGTVEPAQEEKAEPKQEFEYKDLTRIRGPKISDDIDLLCKIYAGCDPDCGKAKLSLCTKNLSLCMNNY